MSATTVTFERIGRNHSVPPLTVESTDPDEVAEAVWRYARTYLGSRWYDVIYDDSIGDVFIEGGRFGRGKATQ